jgi:DNA-binding transcriptional regulator GbsR (MarR family)
MVNSDNKIQDQVEETGKIFEVFGLTPMQGRIVAYFILSDPPEKTFSELLGFFNTSKSSISNSLNWLIDSRIADYRTYSTDRKRYFYLTDDFFRIYFTKVIGNLNELKDHIYRAVSVRSPHHPEVSEQILKWIGEANLFSSGLKEMISKTDDEII